MWTAPVRPPCGFAPAPFSTCPHPARGGLRFDFKAILSYENRQALTCAPYPLVLFLFSCFFAPFPGSICPAPRHLISGILLAETMPAKFIPTELQMSRKLIFGERRRHQRKSCVFEIDLNDHHGNFRCYLRDLSLGGALVEHPSRFKPDLGQELLLTIPFRKRSGVVVVKGHVVRARAGIVAVAFRQGSSQQF